MERLKTALIGLAGVGGDYLAALRSDDGFDLVAVADTDPEVLRRHVEGASLRAYDDYRSLIVETAHAGLDVLFVALEPFQSIEFMELAASRGIGVFHKAPFARNVEEARRVIARFDANGCSFMVSRFWQCEPTFADVANLSELIGRAHNAAGIVRTADHADGWRGDRGRAGGGVLLNGAYEQLDMLVSVLDVPGSVYAQCSVEGAPGAARKYDTEDAATLSLKLKGNRTASVTAWRSAPDPGWHITFVGEKGTVKLCEDGMTVVHRGESLECGTGFQPVGPTGWRAVPQTVRKNPIAAAVSAVRAAHLAGNGLLTSTAADHLKTLAVIEAAYLSAKTGSPETPTRFLT